MKRARLHRWIRKAHRYLGLLIGIQFLLWTLGGLYFSWVDLDTVHGSDRLEPPPSLDASYRPVSLDGLAGILEGQGPLLIEGIELRVISDRSAAYHVTYRTGDDRRQSALIDAERGLPREPLSEAEAIALARIRYGGEAEVLATRLLESAGAHDEYRELPLPAYAVTFGDARRTTLYVAPELARITAVRNHQWRAFDFLWMLHTMDYEGRDNFNNVLLKAFAVFGLLTLFSGFALFFISSRLFRRRQRTAV